MGNKERLIFFVFLLIGIPVGYGLSRILKLQRDKKSDHSSSSDK